MSNRPAISAAVCTHNGAARLAECLRSLLAQQLDQPFEVLVILNACTDGSADIATQFAAEAPDRVRVIGEPRLGLSHARNRALTDARAPVVAYIDDDAVAECDWLAALLRVWAAEPDAACVGGRIHLKWEGPRPDWWVERLDEVFGYFDYPTPRMRMHHPRYPYGGNISFRRDAALAAGGFNPALGRIGRRLVAGEEGELCYKLERAGKRILYDRGPLVHHAARPDRVSRRFILRRAIMHGRSQRIIETHHRMSENGMPSWSALLADLLDSAFRGRLDLPKLKWLTYRAGYRFEQLHQRFKNGDSPLFPAFSAAPLPSPQTVPGKNGDRPREDRCCFCGGAWRPRYRMGRFDVLQCVRCGSGTVSPVPTDGELRAFYDGFLAHLNVKRMPVVQAAMSRLFPDLGLPAGGGLRMLDIGGGGGFYSRAFERLGYGQSTYVDLDPRSCEFAREQLGLARVHNCDAMDFHRLSGERFDFIYARHLIEHLVSPTAFLTEVLKSLSPRGMLVIQCPNGDSLEYLAYPSSTIRDRLRSVRTGSGLAAADVLAIWLTGGMLHGIDPPRHLWAITGKAMAAWARGAKLTCRLRRKPLWDLAYSPGYRPRKWIDRLQAAAGRFLLAPLRGGTHLVAILRRA